MRSMRRRRTCKQTHILRNAMLARSHLRIADWALCGADMYAHPRHTRATLYLARARVQRRRRRSAV